MTDAVTDEVKSNIKRIVNLLLKRSLLRCKKSVMNFISLICRRSFVSCIIRHLEPVNMRVGCALMVIPFYGAATGIRASAGVLRRTESCASFPLLLDHAQPAQLCQHIRAMRLDIDIGIHKAHDTLFINDQSHARGELIILLHRAV